MAAILTWRLSLRCTQAGRFDKAPESILRNTLSGQMLHAICPYAGPARLEPPCSACVRQLDCVYPQVIKPVALTQGAPTPPPGLVLRYTGPEAPRRGAAATVDLTCMGEARTLLPELAAWVAEACARGVGARRNRVHFEVVDRLALAPPQSPLGERLRMRLQTPLILRVRRGERRVILRTITGADLADAIRKRFAGLDAACGALGVRVPEAAPLTIESPQLKRATRRAYSGRQDKTLRAEGLVGEATLRGDLDAWREALAWATRIGIGRMTAWGNGRFELARP